MSEAVNKLEKIPFTLDREELWNRCPVNPASERGQAMERLIEGAEEVAKPKSVYTVAYVTDRGESSVEIGDVKFESQVLRDQLDDVERVFPYISTCGRGLEELVPKDDLVLQSVSDDIKEQALGAARDYLSQAIQESYQTGNISSMSPGSGGEGVWSIGEQEKLFSLFQGEEESIGVKLTDSLTMVPNKTTSGIIYETEVDFKSCQLCQRDNCPSRQAKYDPDLAAEYGLEQGSEE